MKYLKYMFSSWFSYFVTPDKLEQTKLKERFYNYRHGHGYIDHDQLMEEKGIFIDEVIVGSYGGVKRTDRAMQRMLKQPKMVEILKHANIIVDRCNKERKNKK